MKPFEEKIFKYLSDNLNPKRFEHSYFVSKLAAEFAVAYGEDVLKAQTAGLIHDCAKNFGDKKLINMSKKNKKNIGYYGEIVKYSPQLLHSHVSARVAEKEFKISDRDILNAVRNHTLGRADMSTLEKILFVADAVSPDRKYRYCSEIIRTARENLDDAVLLVAANKIKYILDSKEWLCPQSIETWNFYAEKN